MITTFKDIQGLLKRQNAITDNLVFRLHYRLTGFFLFAVSIILSSATFFGVPILCIGAIKDDISEDLLNTFCWIHATFSVPDAWNKTVGEDVPYPGVERHRHLKAGEPGARRVYHKYYQWVCWVLLLQGVFFYLPRYIWRIWEGKRINNLIGKLNQPVENKEDKKKSLTLLIQYLTTHNGSHRSFVISYVICELLNFANVVGQMFIIDTFLGGEFTQFGTEVLSFTGDPDQEFRYGPSGDVQRHDAYCVLPLNIINEKVYILLWFWFVVLTVVSGLALVYRAITLSLYRARKFVFTKQTWNVSEEVIEKVLESRDPGDFFILYLIAKNLDPVNLKTVLEALAFDGKISELKGSEEPLLVKNSE